MAIWLNVKYFQSGASGQLVFPSVSPSPAGGSFFGQDLSGLDFSNAIFGTTADQGKNSTSFNWIVRIKEK